MKIYEVKKRLAQAVLEERNRRKITQAELAKEIGTSVRTLQKIEKAEANPEYETLYRLVRALYLDPNQFLIGVGAEISTVKSQLMMQVLECNEEDRKFLMELFDAALKVYRDRMK